MTQQAFYHKSDQDWLTAPDGSPRGYIQPQELTELWFHTGTICNLSCPFCLEGSKPGDDRLNKVSLDDVKPFIDEAVAMGVQKFSFTGGEPFVIKDMIKILDYALDYKPCLVLTNATNPLKMRLDQLEPLLDKPNPLNFRISFDYPDPERHDAGRGQGNFFLSLATMKELNQLGFKISIARQREVDENIQQVDAQYQNYFKQAGVPQQTRIVSFPDFLKPGSLTNVPHITEACMTNYHSEESRNAFMCNFSKMVVKQDGKMRVYACTLVDDDNDYDLGGSLDEAMRARVMLKHHRCYSCFANGASCSEM